MRWYSVAVAGGSHVSVMATTAEGPRAVQAKAILIASYGDTPSHAVQACELSHAAAKGCGRCAITTSRHKPADEAAIREGIQTVALSSNAYAGYAEATTCQRISPDGTYLPQESIRFMKLVAGRGGGLQADQRQIAHVKVTDVNYIRRANTARHAADEEMHGYHAAADTMVTPTTAEGKDGLQLIRLNLNAFVHELSSCKEQPCKAL